MQVATRISSVVESSLAEQKPILRVIALYDGTAARDWVLETCLDCFAKFGPEHFAWYWHSFEDLHDPIRSIEAEENAEKADLLIIGSSRNRITHRVKEWIESWAEMSQGAERALVAMLSDDCDSEDPSMLEWLRESAEKADIQFLPRTVHAPLHEEEDLTSNYEGEHGFRCLAWGINE